MNAYKKIQCIVSILFFGFFSGCYIIKAHENAPTAYQYQSYKNIPGVTADEIRAIEELQKKVSSFTYGMTPSSEAFYGENNKIKGYSALLCKWLTELFGIQFSPEIFIWGDLVSGLETGKIDFTGELTATDERRKTFFMTDPIASRSLKYFRLYGSTPLSEIAKKRLLRFAILEDTTTIDEVNSSLDKDTFEIVLLDDAEKVYAMLKSNEVDAYINEGPEEAIFDVYQDVVAKDFLPLVYSPISLTTQNPKLEPIISVVQKALKKGSIKYLTELYNRGYQEYLIHKLSLKFTEEEREYIQHHPEILFVAESDNYPVSFYNKYDKEWQGIFFDTLHEIEKLTGLSFKLVNSPNHADFGNLMRILETGEASIISELIRTNEREGRFLWPQKALFSDKYALLSKWELNNIKINDILQLKVGIKKGTAHAIWFQKNFPNHAYTVEFENTDVAFKALANNEVDMIMSRVSQLLTLTNYHELMGYKANHEFDVSYESIIGFNKNEAVLCSIINKVMPLIDIELLSRQWMNKSFDYRQKLAQTQRYWLSVAVLLILCITILLYVLFRKTRNAGKMLESLVHNRTAELESISNKYKDASRAKSDFLSHISHEIRTPLNAIIGMIRIGTNTNDIDKKNYCFERTNSASKHLLGIINDILDISKIEANKFDLLCTEFNFEQMLKNVSNIANIRAEEKKQNLVVDMDKDVPAIILSDELRLSQVITNLLSNAIKFSPEKGTIVLSIKKTDEINDEVTLRIEVMDNGIGISEDQQKRLFSSFSQADASITQKFGGTGLGLAISKRIVELMGGTIWIESELGKGAKFIFTIKTKNIGKKSNTTSPVNINTKNLRILTVTNYTEKEYFIYVMQSLKLSCDVVSGGHEAIHMMKKAMDKPYNIFFIDWQMPDMDGIELAKKIKEIDSNNSIVIMVSATNWNTIEKEALTAGINCFMPKPLFPSTLVDTINNCAGRGLKNIARSVQEESEKKNYNFYGHTILIAEDVEINREIMSAILEETKVSIDYAINGNIAVSMFSEQPEKYSLILMDINMPKWMDILRREQYVLLLLHEQRLFRSSL